MSTVRHFYSHDNTKHKHFTLDQNTAYSVLAITFTVARNVYVTSAQLVLSTLSRTVFERDCTFVTKWA